MAETQQKAYREPVGGRPPKSQVLIEKVAMLGVLTLGILLILAAVTDMLFFNANPRQVHLLAMMAGIFGIVVWAAHKLLWGRIVT